MSEVKHTPGPWVYRPHEFDDWGYVRAQKDDDGFHSFICQAKDPRVTEDDENAARKNMVDPWEANARLIAAAPEMLETLEKWVELIERTKKTQSLFLKIEANSAADFTQGLRETRAAIAKAKGK